MGLPPQRPSSTVIAIITLMLFSLVVRALRLPAGVLVLGLVGGREHMTRLWSYGEKVLLAPRSSFPRVG